MMAMWEQFGRAERTRMTSITLGLMPDRVVEGPGRGISPAFFMKRCPFDFGSAVRIFGPNNMWLLFYAGLN